MRYIQAFLITTAIFAISIYMISFIFKKVSVVNRKKVIKVVTITKKDSAKIVKKAKAKKEQPTIKQKPNKEPQNIIKKPTKKIVKPKVLHKNIGKKTEKKRLVKKESLAKKVAIKKRKKIVAKKRKKVVAKKITSSHKNIKKLQKTKHIKKYKLLKKRTFKAKKKVLKRYKNEVFSNKKAYKTNKKNRVKKSAHKKTLLPKPNNNYVAKNSYSNIAKSNFLARVRAKIKANLVYPQSALLKHIEGRAELVFDITSSGTIANIRFIRAKRMFRNSAIRAVKSASPLIVPANVKLPIKDIYLPLKFSLN